MLCSYSGVERESELKVLISHHITQWPIGYYIEAADGFKELMTNQ